MSARPPRPRAAPHVRGGGLRAQPARGGGSRRSGATGEVRHGHPGSGRLGPGPLLALPPGSSPLARPAGRAVPECPCLAGAAVSWRCLNVDLKPVKQAEGRGGQRDAAHPGAGGRIRALRGYLPAGAGIPLGRASGLRCGCAASASKPADGEPRRREGSWESCLAPCREADGKDGIFGWENCAQQLIACKMGAGLFDVTSGASWPSARPGNERLHSGEPSSAVPAQVSAIKQP
ncbi:uncharacterized protein LOC121233460 [Aquila chrysaetos chrysaetos]|uniref:uncharacterized protein LOC121233460 n=1 Tax=Aquila chrysaetos chrysaetos TaxID=223781 RepID=UPI001B7D4296|nr:uncharacterized protein LOC121233460 [Aquila chrysaetos chrysaetos]XP_040980980.1 uncharacterized protein LOC121233460 [Aquila chrysaetos chrysaetos]